MVDKLSSIISFFSIPTCQPHPWALIFARHKDHGCESARARKPYWKLVSILHWNASFTLRFEGNKARNSKKICVNNINVFLYLLYQRSTHQILGTIMDDFIRFKTKYVWRPDSCYNWD